MQVDPAALVDQMPLHPGIAGVLDRNPAAAQLQAVDDVREDAPDAWAEDDLPGVEHHATEGAQVVAQRLAQGTDAVLGLERVGGLPPGPVPVPQVDHRIVRTPRHGSG